MRVKGDSSEMWIEEVYEVEEEKHKEQSRAELSDVAISTNCNTSLINRALISRSTYKYIITSVAVSGYRNENALPLFLSPELSFSQRLGSCCDVGLHGIDGLHLL